MRGAVEVGGAVHGIAPLRYDGADGGEVLLDGRSGGGGGEGGVVVEERLVLEGGVWDEVVGGDLAGSDFERGSWVE